MKKYVAQFFKISFEQFKQDWLDENPTSKTKWSDEEIEKIYSNIKLPKRATCGSAGYDFCMPVSVTIEPGETKKIPTGIRCKLDYDWVLMLCPRSSLGFKYRLQLDNTVGIIDADYFESDNEGHIFVKITNDTNKAKTVNLSQGDAFAQGIFLQYGVAVDDEVTRTRNGGLGSTDEY